MSEALAPKMRLSLAILILLLALPSSSANNSAPNGLIFKEYQFPSRSGLTHLCRQRVYGSGAEITWDAFASAAKPSALINYYRRKLGSGGFTKENESGVWRLPPNTARPQRVLEILPAGADAPYKSCEKSPPAKTQSIVMISKMS